jgi:hypothetical protein
VTENSNCWITFGGGLPYKMPTTFVKQKGISDLTGNRLYYESV